MKVELLRRQPHEAEYHVLSWFVRITIDDGVCCFGDLAWDEMLGVVARAACKAMTLAFPTWQNEPVPDGVQPYLTITNTDDGCLWCVERDGRFLDHLGGDEMLGFVAQITLTGHEMFGGMRTYEQRMNCPWHVRRREERPPVALLEARR